MAFTPIHMYSPAGRRVLVGSAVEREQLRAKGYTLTAPKPAEPAAPAKPEPVKPAPKPVVKAEPVRETKPSK